MFWWGGSVAQCASFSHKWNVIHYNEFDYWIYNVFRNLWKIDISEIKKRFLTREEFTEIKNKQDKKPEDEVLLMCWSFWNNQKDYLYWKDIEERKQLLHNLHFGIGIDNDEQLQSMLNQLSYSRIYFEKYRIFYVITRNQYKAIKYFRTDLKKYKTFRKDLDWNIIDDNQLRYWINEKKNNKKTLINSEVTVWSNTMDHLERLERLQSLQSLQSLERLQSLESLERLQSLESLERLQYSNLSYDQIKLKEWDVLYCDPPYEWTDGYRVWDFDHIKFRDFVKNTPYPCYVSSYNWPDNMFCFKLNVTQKLSKSKDNSKQTERIYRNGK